MTTLWRTGRCGRYGVGSELVRLAALHHAGTGRERRARARPIHRRERQSVGTESSGLADRLNRLFAKVHPTDRGPYSNEEVAQAIRRNGGEISRAYIAYLRSGERKNPTMQHIEALAAFFGVKPSYFFDEGVANSSDAELDLLIAMRNSGIRTIALRAAELSPTGLKALADIIERVRDLDGLPTELDEPTT